MTAKPEMACRTWSEERIGSYDPDCKYTGNVPLQADEAQNTVFLDTECSTARFGFPLLYIDRKQSRQGE